MDDIKITSKSVFGGKWMLQDLGELIDWARTKFKPSKSRSLILKKGKLSGKPANIEHVSSSCRTALKDGIYTWRHDQVLQEKAAVLNTQSRNKTKIEKDQKFINFIKGGRESSKNTYRQVNGIIATANDWEMQADIWGNTNFPKQV
ncbi:Hypothetical predicted protein [Mytilus galloprovincialis]|uniref:Reverse transcriptase domain-containing protein n=1 Tax=Mytilus galloprovincialis TaxID=29158 RepID=A0A8B6ETZ8_MYTGA|nr:Hypothetical predicted protein [Mytilus galloprovincialis]